MEVVEKPETVYNFQVEDFHTNYLGNISIFVHNDCEYKINSDGEIEVTDWKEYPDGRPKPEGSLQLIYGDEYEAARKAANTANRNIHNADPSLKGLDIHEVKPVKW